VASESRPRCIASDGGKALPTGADRQNDPRVNVTASLVSRQRQLVLVLPGLIVVAGGLLLATEDGGYPPTVWYPAALFALVLLTIVVLSAPPSRLEPRSLAIGLGAFGLLTVLAYLSMAWADSPGDAWLSANRILLYGLVLLLVTLHPWSRTGALVAVALTAFGVAAIAAGILAGGVISGDPADLFLGGRLAEPAGYLNATANLWLIGLWPAVYLATMPSWPPWARALALSAATLLVEIELLSQSRGAVIAFVASGLVYILLTPRRWSTLFTIAVLLGLTALAWGPLVDVRDAARAADLGPALDHAARAIAISAVAAFVLGFAAALLRERSRSEVERRPWIRRAGIIGLAALAVGGVVAVLIAIGNPSDWVDARWQDFKTSGYTQVESGHTRFTGGLGSNRYDFYRVALDQFKGHPIVGVGGDNFADAYLLHRRTLEAPRHPHSLAFRMLSQYGLVGTTLFVIFLAGFLAAVLRARRAGGPEDAALVTAAFAGFAAFFFHALVDWLWAFPALGVLAFALLGVAARTEALPADAPAARAARMPFFLRLGFGVAVLAAAVSLAAPGIAGRYTASAYEHFRQHPQTALDQLTRAADLDPLSDEPLVAQGVIEQRLGRPARAVGPLRRAIERRPGNWFSHLELGLAEAELGHMGAAVVGLREAARLNPRQPVVRSAYRKVRAGQKIDAVAIERALYLGLQDRLRATDPDAASHSESDAPGN
jgi:tetratricopeptide (TPR) repeat protein